MPTKATTRRIVRVAIDVARSLRKPLWIRGLESKGAVVAGALLLLSLTTALPAAESPVVPADGSRFHLVRDPSEGGLWLRDRTLWFGGDATMTATVPEHGRSVAELDDVSLLSHYDASPRLSFFSEMRIENTLLFEQGRDLRAGSGDASIERLYADVIVAPHLTLRIGKLLTPFGLWNVIRRAPLSWSIERPAATEQTFPQHVTGLSLTYQATWHGWSFDATGYGPAQDELAFRNHDETGLIAGGRAAAGHSLGPAFATLGFNGASFEDGRTERWVQTIGTDGEIDVWGHQLTGEFIYSHLRGPSVTREFGAYLQDAIPLTPEVYGVLRLDYIQPRTGGDSIGGLVGGFWRPVPWLIVKLNYQFATHRTDNLDPGFVAAVSLIF